MHSINRFNSTQFTPHKGREAKEEMMTPFVSDHDSGTDGRAMSKQANTLQQKQECQLDFAEMQEIQSQENRGRAKMYRSAFDSPVLHSYLKKPEYADDENFGFSSFMTPEANREVKQFLNQMKTLGEEGNETQAEVELAHLQPAPIRQKADLGKEMALKPSFHQDQEESKHQDEAGSTQGKLKKRLTKNVASISKTPHGNVTTSGTRFIAIGGRNLAISCDAKGKFSVTENGTVPDFMSEKRVRSDGHCEYRVSQRHLKFLHFMANSRFVDNHEIATFKEIEEGANLTTESVQGIVQDLRKVIGFNCIVNVCNEGYKFPSVFANPFQDKRLRLIADQELGLSRAGTTHESSNRTYTRPSGISRSLIQERHKALFKLFADNKFELLTRQNIKEKTGLTDSFLKGIVGDLRNVFGKDCIETVHGIGYRFTPK